MVTSIRDSYGERAYLAYRHHVGGVSPITKAVLPAWDEQSEEIRQAWMAAASAVLSGIVPGTVVRPTEFPGTAVRPTQ